MKDITLRHVTLLLSSHALKGQKHDQQASDVEMIITVEINDQQQHSLLLKIFSTSTTHAFGLLYVHLRSLK